MTYTHIVVAVILMGLVLGLVAGTVADDKPKAFQVKRRHKVPRAAKRLMTPGDRWGKIG